MENVFETLVEIERILRSGAKPRFYYGGSFGKKTMIAAQFDLDVVVYFPAGSDSPAALYEAVEGRLRASGLHVARHNVALRLRYTPGWHIDVVPARAPPVPVIGTRDSVDRVGDRRQRVQRTGACGRR